MKILVVGAGAREHALAWKIKQSPRVDKIYCAPGNGGIADLAECVDIKATDIKGLLKFAKKEKIDLTVVGPEAPLVEGIVDEFRAADLKIFGPTKSAARLEASKSFAKEIMKEFGVPTAGALICQNMEEVASAIKEQALPVVIKADGLAAGKGVIICQTQEAASEAASNMLIKKVFGSSGATVIVEDCLEGEEVSILVLTDGKTAIPLATSQDHKRIFDNDEGPNTGGMGAYSPASVVTSEMQKVIMDKIINPVIKGMEEEDRPYQGILYAGIMVTKDGPKVLEFNVRFGDPETQAVFLRLKSDLVEAMLWTIGEVNKEPVLEWDKRFSVCVVAASGGYPGPYEKGKQITGLEEVAGMKDIVVFHAGTKKSQDKYLTSGGRVLGITGLGNNLKDAIDLTYKAVAKIKFEGMHCRSDIGWRALKQN